MGPQNTSEGLQLQKRESVKGKGKEMCWYMDAILESSTDIRMFQVGISSNNSAKGQTVGFNNLSLAEVSNEDLALT